MTWFCVYVVVVVVGRMGGWRLRRGGEQFECVCKIILSKSLFFFREVTRVRLLN